MNELQQHKCMWSKTSALHCIWLIEWIRKLINLPNIHTHVYIYIVYQCSYMFWRLSQFCLCSRSTPVLVLLLEFCLANNLHRLLTSHRTPLPHTSLYIYHSFGLRQKQSHNTRTNVYRPSSSNLLQTDIVHFAPQIKRAISTRDQSK